LCVALLASACGGGDGESETVAEDQTTGGGERPREVDDGLEVEGLMGSLSTDEVNGTLQPRMQRFARCFSDRYGSLDIVGGRVRFSFRVAVDGSVRWVYPSESTIGDRQTERCLLDVAGSTRFPQPRGGEAEFSFPIEFDPPGDVRPPFNWEPERTEELVAENGAGVLSQCGARGPVSVTAYVAPGGAVLAAGASVADQSMAEVLDCVSDAVRAWSMPDPGSYPAKVTFLLQ
jgi:hypothetical protein